MIGNDIVDIKQTRLDTDWSRPNFVQKVFNQQEQFLIKQSADPFYTVWRMWSMKESAYKFFLQSNPNLRRFFNPSIMACEVISKNLGTVRVYGMEVNTHTRYNAEYIFTFAWAKSLNHIQTNIVYLKEGDSCYQSNKTHEELIKYISKSNGLEKNSVEIRKNRRAIPRIYYKNKEMAINVSLTHHGNYGAFSISTCNND